MQFVGTHEVFGLLLYVAFFVGRNKLRADGRVHDIEQGVACGFVGGKACECKPAHEVFHKRLGNACIHAIHRHVVAVVGSPAESQLREVAGAEYDAAALVGVVHKNLCALPGLRVLVGDIVIVDVVVDVGKVLLHGIDDRDFLDSHA